MIKLQKGLVQLLLTVFQTGVHVVIIPAGLLHSKRFKHAADHQGWAGCGINVLPGTSAFPKNSEMLVSGTVQPIHHFSIEEGNVAHPRERNKQHLFPNRQEPVLRKNGQLLMSRSVP